MIRGDWGGNEVEWIEKAEARQTDKSPVRRRSIQSYIPTYSRLRKREPLIALGSHQGGGGGRGGGGRGTLLSASAIPHCGSDTFSNSSLNSEGKMKPLKTACYIYFWNTIFHLLKCDSFLVNGPLTTGWSFLRRTTVKVVFPKTHHCKSGRS